MRYSQALSKSFAGYGRPVFAAAIDELLSNDELREQMAEASHERVKEMFTDQIAVSKMREIYHEL